MHGSGGEAPGLVVGVADHAEEVVHLLDGERERDLRRAGRIRMRRERTFGKRL